MQVSPSIKQSFLWKKIIVSHPNVLSLALVDTIGGTGVRGTERPDKLILPSTPAAMMTFLAIYWFTDNERLLNGRCNRKEGPSSLAGLFTMFQNQVKTALVSQLQCQRDIARCESYQVNTIRPRCLRCSTLTGSVASAVDRCKRAKFVTSSASRYQLRRQAGASDVRKQPRKNGIPGEDNPTCVSMEIPWSTVIVHEQ